MKRTLSWILVLAAVLMMAVPSVALASTELTLSGRQHLTSDIRITTITATLSNAGDDGYSDTGAIWWESGNSRLVTLIEYQSHMSGGQAQATFRGRYNTPENGVQVKAIVKNSEGKPLSSTRTVYVSGLTYLPQTGQDTRTLTIVGVLCAAMFGMAGVFYARKTLEQIKALPEFIAAQSLLSESKE